MKRYLYNSPLSGDRFENLLQTRILGICRLTSSKHSHRTSSTPASVSPGALASCLKLRVFATVFKPVTALAVVAVVFSLTFASIADAEPVEISADEEGIPAGAREAVGPHYYDQLAPHGHWHYVNGMGWVWTPHRSVVGPSFHPYVTEGDWTPTNKGWMFVSNYTWGRIPFHYGRWYWSAGYGWTWVPGDRWAPAWVKWRLGDGYLGWAPLPPARIPLSIRAWSFCHSARMDHPYVTRYVLPRHQTRVIYHRTRYIPRGVGHRWHYGPKITFHHRRHRRFRTIQVPRRSMMVRAYLKDRVRHDQPRIHNRPKRHRVRYEPRVHPRPHRIHRAPRHRIYQRRHEPKVHPRPHRIHRAPRHRIYRRHEPRHGSFGTQQRSMDHKRRHRRGREI